LILVTGSSGFIGSRLSHGLISRDCRVRTAIRGDGPTSIDDLAKCDAIVVGGIHASTDWSVALRGVEVVVHCAARAHVMHDRARDSLSMYRTVNVDATRRLAEQAASAGVRRLIFLSSVKATAERSLPGHPLRVDDIPSPEDAYGISKLEAEQSLWEVSARTGLEIVIVRPPLVYGPGVKGNFLRLLRLVSWGVPLPLGSINNARSMVYIDNLVDFLHTCVFSSASAGRTFFPSDGQDLSTIALIRKLADATGRPARLLPMPPYALMLLGRMIGKSMEIERFTATLQVDLTDARRLLDWSPPYTVDHGLGETVTWFLNQS